jgi:hypothetical protein
MSNIRLNLLSPSLFYQNPVDIFQTQNGSTQVDGVSSEINSCRGCNQNLASSDPASQYQRQKLIQNTVRVYSSLYTMNLAGLSGYQKPSSKYQLIEQAGMQYYAPPGVNWNQMSDRANPANQLTKVASGSTYHSSSTKHSITRDRPGSMSPGGIGVDIKHNSYERRLNKLKGKSVLRRGVIPPNYGSPIPFNKAFPVYGGKVIKTAIINNCDCPDIVDNVSGSVAADTQIYGSKLSATQDLILSVGYKFNIGDFVWAKKDILSGMFYKAQIINIIDGVYEIKFVDDETIKYTSESSLLIYFDCNCTFEPSISEVALSNQYTATSIEELINKSSALACNILTILTATEII